MDTATAETISRIEEQIHGLVSAQASHAAFLRTLRDGQQQIIELLTPEEQEGPGLSELLAHMIGQQTDMIGYLRQIIRTQTAMEQNTPGDVVRALTQQTQAAGHLTGGSNGATQAGTP